MAETIVAQSNSPSFGGGNSSATISMRWGAVSVTTLEQTVTEGYVFAEMLAGIKPLTEEPADCET